MTVRENEVKVVVGNTLRRIPQSEAKLDRTGKFCKVNEWVLYVDVVEGNPDLIRTVTFDLGKTFRNKGFVSRVPELVQKSPQRQSTLSSNARPVWRFQTPPQKTAGSVSATAIVMGAGETRMDIEYRVVVSGKGGRQQTERIFRETNSLPRLPKRKIDKQQMYGVELELNSAQHCDTATIAETVNQRLRKSVMELVVIDTYLQGRRNLGPDTWKLVPDSSIICHRSDPDCNKFELVSPILQGGHGLHKLDLVLRAFDTLPIRVNKSMGFHVHINVEALSTKQLVKICQNFIKYEDAMDAVLPPSRRSGSPECTDFFRSNRQAMSQSFGLSTHKERHDALQSCRDIRSLANLMNPEGPNGSRYYKLNLQNLVTNRQPTLEFRQHSGTFSFDKISAWVRFCSNFVANSALSEPPMPFRENGCTLTRQFEVLFYSVIKDRALADYYRHRKRELEEQRWNKLCHEHDVCERCCDECARGGTCQRKIAI